MKETKIYLWFFGFVFIFGFYGIVLWDGGALGGPSCNCQPWPEPTSGPFLLGDFTVAFEKSLYMEVELPYYNFQVKLKRGTQIHLYSRSLQSGGRNICDYTDAEIKDLYQKLPCIMGVGEDYGLSGVPVIYDLKVTSRDWCGEKIGIQYPPSYEAQDAMISGKITIRVVPATCQ